MKATIAGIFLAVLSIFSAAARAHGDTSVFATGAAPAAHHHDDHDDRDGYASGVKLYPGLVVIDPRQMVNIVVKINARVAELRDLYVGKNVTKGEILGQLESAELETIQQTYLSIVSNLDAVQAFSVTSSEKLIDARINLAWKGMSADEIKRIEETGRPLKKTAVRSPVSGFVYAVNVVNHQILNAGAQSGQFTALGTTFSSIARPEAVSVEASVPAAEAGAIRPGQPATVYLPGPDSGRVPVTAAVQQVYGFVNPANQRQTVRLKLNHLPGGVMPMNGMAASVSFGSAGNGH